MKKIIVPIDFSEHSEYALEAASNIARKYNSELIVLHMLELSNAILTAGSVALNEEAEEKTKETTTSFAFLVVQAGTFPAGQIHGARRYNKNSA